MTTTSRSEDAMSYATDVSPIVVDIETCGVPNAAEFLEPVQPDGRLTDPDKIKADIAAKELARIEKVALDWNVGRIAAIGWWTEQHGVDHVICPDETHEAYALKEFWAASKNRTLIGFNIKGFDARFLVRRSQLLQVAYTPLDFGKYTRRGVIDLYLDLTFGDGHYDQGCMKRSLHAFCRRFGIPVDDTVKGADIPALVAAGKWGTVQEHVISDVELTVALARRVGVLRAEVPEPVL